MSMVVYLTVAVAGVMFIAMSLAGLEQEQK
jgi:hypothetical protein